VDNKLKENLDGLGIIIIIIIYTHISLYNI
jgi:hypothetical protein